MTLYGYSDGSASCNPYFGGWSFLLTTRRGSEVDSWTPRAIVCHGRGGRTGMKLGEAEISPLAIGLAFICDGLLWRPDDLPSGTSIIWTVDSEFVAMIWAGTYKAKQYKSLWASIRRSETVLSEHGIDFSVVHSLRNRCPGQIKVDEWAGVARKSAMTHGEFVDLTWRLKHVGP